MSALRRFAAPPWLELTCMVVFGALTTLSYVAAFTALRVDPAAPLTVRVSVVVLMVLGAVFGMGIAVTVASHVSGWLAAGGRFVHRLWMKAVDARRGDFCSCTPGTCRTQDVTGTCWRGWTYRDLPREGAHRG